MKSAVILEEMRNIKISEKESMPLRNGIAISVEELYKVLENI